MIIGDQLPKEIKKQLKEVSHQGKSESFSRWEIEELMGKNMPTSKRVSGRIRSVNRK